MKKICMIVLLLSINILTFAAPNEDAKKSNDITNPLFLGHFMSKGYSINAGATWIDAIDELGIITYDRIAIADKSKPNGFNNFFIDYVLEYTIKPKNAPESTALQIHVLNSSIIIDLIYMPDTDNYLIIFQTNGSDEKRRDIIYKDDKSGDEERLKEESERKKKEDSHGLIIDTKPKEVSYDKNNKNALLEAIYNGRTEQAILIIDEGIIDINYTASSTGTPALYQAVERDLPAVVKKLIEKKADVNYKDRIGKTPLFIAIERRCDFEIIKQLVNAKADCNVVSKTSETILIKLIKGQSKNKYELLEYLLKNGANVNLSERFNVTPLMVAVRKNADKRIDDSPLVQLLIKYKADVNAKDSSGKTPLKIAKMYKNNDRVIDMLIAAGAKK